MHHILFNNSQKSSFSVMILIHPHDKSDSIGIHTLPHRFFKKLIVFKIRKSLSPSWTQRTVNTSTAQNVVASLLSFSIVSSSQKPVGCTIFVKQWSMKMVGVMTDWGMHRPPCPAHHPQPQVIHVGKWKRLLAHPPPPVGGPSQPSHGPFSGPGLKWHRSVLQISYRYLIIALGIQLDYEKVCFKLLLCSLAYLCRHQTWASVALYSFRQEKVLRYPPLILFLRSLFMV